MKNMHQYLESIYSLIYGLPHSNLVNWFAVDSTGEVHGFRYKPKYYANGWSQNVEHPECKIYEYYFGALTEEYKVTLPEVKKLVFRVSDVLSTHVYDCNVEFEKHLDFMILGDVLSELSNSGLGDVEDWWVCTDSKKNTYVHEARPYIQGGTFASEGRTRYLGSHLYFTYGKIENSWGMTLIQVKDIRAFMNKQVKRSSTKAEPELATKVIPVDTAIASIDQQISKRKYQIAKLEAEINSLEIAKTILSE